jgi:glyoxylase-like metal-dependent hydrolase (beta-lactamase superfamily II)
LTAPKFHPLESFLESMTRIEKMAIDSIWPSHGRPFTNLEGRIDAIRKHHFQRSQLALQALNDGPRSARQVSQFIFGNALPAFDQLLALNESYVHLAALENRGLAGRRKEGNGRCLFERLTP